VKKRPRKENAPAATRKSGKLKIRKTTLKDLNAAHEKAIKGGVVRLTNTCIGVTCGCGGGGGGKTIP
jgi:hypothetical protein